MLGGRGLGPGVHLSAGVNGVLLDILVVLVAAKVAAEAAERLGLPAVVGEILAGLAIGPSALGLVGPSEVLRTLAELGVILLLLQVGLEMDLAELGAVGRSSLQVAVFGVAVPFVAGYAVALAFGESTNTAIFVGAAMTATSVGITARVFGDLRALASVEARTVLGAAVADDVIGLVILTVVVRLVSDGSISVVSVAGVAGLAVAFLAVTTGVGVKLAPGLFGLVHRLARSPGTMVAVALAFTLAVAELASAARLATVVGAFVAGLSLARTDQAERIRTELTPVGHLFVPVFFLQIGIDADVASLLHPHVLLLAAALLVVAVAGKVAAGLGAVGRGDRILIGIGMLPRGEVGLIFAGIGLREKILSPDLYGAVLLVVLVTTLVTPPLLGWRLKRVQAARRASVAAITAPPGGWLVVGDGVVDLRSETDALPAPHEALRLGLRAAFELRSARPGPRLLDWLSSLGDIPAQWDRGARQALFDLLRDGNARSWRFLETTGLLERALPELAEAVRRRRADPFELDPAHALRFALVDRAHELVVGNTGGEAPLPNPERLMLAALLVEVGAEVPTARQVVKRLDLGAAAEQDVALLVGESTLLRAAAARADGLDEERVLQIASHLERPDRARALWLLSLALAPMPPVQRQRLDALYELVQAVLARPELAGREVRNVVQQRRLAACRTAGPGTAPAERLEHAPQAWLLAHEPEALARMAGLVEPLPGKDDARLRVLPAADGTWRLELACRDQRGLLAVLTAALAGAGLNVLDASLASWADGGVADTFTVRSEAPPDPDELARQITAARKRPLSAPPVADAVVTFDGEASPWHTLCTVEAADRPGLLHTLAVAFAVSGADVHSARVTTKGNTAHDAFQLTDGRGEKLGPDDEQAIRRAILSGVTGSRRPRTKLARNRNNRVTIGKQPPRTVGLEDLANS